jgi:hypothetical protein
LFGKDQKQNLSSPGKKQSYQLNHHQFKMIQKKFLVLSVVVVYIILSVLFFNLQTGRKFYYSLSFYTPSARFCCENEKLCNNEYINDHFNKSLFSEKLYSEWNSSQNLKTLFGKPECFGRLKMVDEDKQWEFKIASEIKPVMNNDE